MNAGETRKVYRQLKEIPLDELDMAWADDYRHALLWLLGIPVVDSEGVPAKYGWPDARAWRDGGVASCASSGECACMQLAVAIHHGGKCTAYDPETGEEVDVAHGQVLGGIVYSMDAGNFEAAMSIIRRWRGMLYG